MVMIISPDCSVLKMKSISFFKISRSATSTTLIFYIFYGKFEVFYITYQKIREVQQAVAEI